MRKVYLAAFVYSILGLASGLFYREATRGFTGVTQLAFVHTHLLALGMLAMLIVLGLDAIFSISGSRSFTWFFFTYNVGLVITVTMLVWHGLLQVAGQPAGPAISGIAGLGHILLSVGIVSLMISLNRPVRDRIAARTAAQA